MDKKILKSNFSKVAVFAYNRVKEGERRKNERNTQNFHERQEEAGEETIFVLSDGKSK